MKTSIILIFIVIILGSEGFYVNLSNRVKREPDEIVTERQEDEVSLTTTEETIIERLTSVTEESNEEQSSTNTGENTEKSLKSTEDQSRDQMKEFTKESTIEPFKKLSANKEQITRDEVFMTTEHKKPFNEQEVGIMKNSSTPNDFTKEPLYTATQTQLFKKLTTELTSIVMAESTAKKFLDTTEVSMKKESSEYLPVAEEETVLTEKSNIDKGSFTKEQTNTTVSDIKNVTKQGHVLLPRPRIHTGFHRK